MFMITARTPTGARQDGARQDGARQDGARQDGAPRAEASAEGYEERADGYTPSPVNNRRPRRRATSPLELPRVELPWLEA